MTFSQKLRTNTTKLVDLIINAIPFWVIFKSLKSFEWLIIKLPNTFVDVKKYTVHIK